MTLIIMRISAKTDVYMRELRNIYIYLNIHMMNSLKYSHTYAIIIE